MLRNMSFINARPRLAPDSLLRNADFTVSTAAQALSLLGDQVAIVVLVLRLHDLGGGGWGVAGVLAAGALPLVLLSPVAGTLVDRVDSQHLLVVSSSAQAALCALLAFTRPVGMVLGLVALLGAAEAVTAATWQALIPRIVGEDRIPAALGLSRSAMTAISVAAPATGGLLAAAYGTRVPLLLDAASYLAVLAAAIVVKSRRGGTAEVRSATGHVWDGFSFLRTDPVIAPLVASLLVFVLLGGMVNVIDVFLVRDTFGASDAWYGAIGALWLTGMVVGSILGGRLGTDRVLTRAALGGAAVIAGVIGAVAAAPSIGWLVPLEVVGGIGNGMLNVAVGALLLGRTPDALRGRVSAAVGGAANAASLAALALGGALATSLAPRTIFAIAAVGGGLCVILTWLPVTRSLARTERSGPGRIPEATTPYATVQP
jgi:MFS family permease